MSPMNPRLLRPVRKGDQDFLAYVAKVEAADAQPLEDGVKKAIADFITGCKGDGIWSAIKDACIPMGARTVAGAMSPLVGAVTQNFQYAESDYNRKTGLLGTSQKYLRFSRNNNSDGQDDNHIYANLTSSGATLAVLVGAGTSTGLSYRTVQFVPGSGVRYRCSTTDWTTVLDGGAAAIGGCGVARNSASGFTSMIRSVAQAQAASSSPLSDSAMTAGYGARIRFASAGSYLSLAALHARVDALASAIAAAIP